VTTLPTLSSIRWYVWAIVVF